MKKNWRTGLSLLCLSMFLLSSAPAETSRTEPVSDEDHIVFSFVGDCSIGDSHTSVKQENSFTQTVAREGYDFPFSLIKGYLQADDITFANLQAVLTTRASLYNKSKRYNLIAAPEHVQILKEGSIEIVNTVNNHCMDFTMDGYTDALATLDMNGIMHFGTMKGSDILQVFQVKGIKVGCVGYSYPQTYDIKNCIDRIAKLKAQGCDLVIVSMHWGRETNHRPIAEQLKFAKQLIDGGADMIWGHHAHVTQPIMFYKGKPVLFNTGNFTFGTMSDVDPATGIFQLEYEIVDGKPVLDMLRVVPCNTGKRGDFRPYELTDEAARRACLKILVNKRKENGFENPPESFLDTGVVLIDRNGSIVQE